eukprot:Cvel_35056.t1-p1 / transcript=Cvel_35056.t1 / gene=Cvel_35056 / organism=Chromera_velia_CCMP2878 / gene_product=hypothetical protein / transcript_product=hypothetical protein / location=Cvel_scaffold6253:1897-2719(+) / protein_length=206 / sequence_SO=supercontig / SO=protein_coding / is_pseudo=false
MEGESTEARPPPLKSSNSKGRASVAFKAPKQPPPAKGKPTAGRSFSKAHSVARSSVAGSIYEIDSPAAKEGRQSMRLSQEFDLRSLSGYLDEEEEKDEHKDLVNPNRRPTDYDSLPFVAKEKQVPDFPDADEFASELPPASRQKGGKAGGGALGLSEYTDDFESLDKDEEEEEEEKRLMFNEGRALSDFSPESSSDCSGGTPLRLV